MWLKEMSESDATHTNEGADGPGTQPRTQRKSQVLERRWGERSPAAWGRGEGGCEKQRHLRWIWKISFPPEEEGPGLGLAKTWSRGGRGPRRRADPARARRCRSRSTSTGVAGSGLCLRVKHESPEHLRLDGQVGKKGTEGPERRRR